MARLATGGSPGPASMPNSPTGCWRTGMIGDHWLPPSRIWPIARTCRCQITDQYADGGSGPLRDICPFTTIGLFNRGITDAKRRAIAGMLAEFLGVEESVPRTFGGIPVLNNMNAWFFQYEVERPGRPHRRVVAGIR